MEERSRSTYLLSLAHYEPVRPGSAGIEIRGVLEGDDAGLGRLMERAYAGTIDDDLGDNTDGELEVRDWRLDGGRLDASVVALEGTEMVSACLVTLAAEGDWWVGYVFTHPARVSQGAGLAVVRAALQRVSAAGARDVRAEVTDGNLPSERLMARAGFTRVATA